MGPTCVPFAVTGGECSHPMQCLTGSVCMRGKCRGPCDDNQLFIKDKCIDYGFNFLNKKIFKFIIFNLILQKAPVALTCHV